MTATAPAEAFSTAQQLAGRWRPLNDDETALATELLGDASTVIRRLARNIDARIAGDPVLGEAAGIVACQMVRRAMSNPHIDQSVTQITNQFGPVSQSASIGDRNLYLTKTEREMLGIRKRAFALDVMPTD